MEPSGASHRLLAQLLTSAPAIESRKAPSLPPPHPAEADTFARHQGVPGHDQRRLSTARVLLVGAGGLNSWTALGLLRSGVGAVTVVDPDIVERSNLPRQLYYSHDLGKPKALRLVHNLVAHSTAAARVTGIAAPVEQAMDEFLLPADVWVVGVDNNRCRLACAREARRRRIPAVFTMLSGDGMRVQSFLQGPDPEDACLWCALPNLDPERAMPCAAAIISGCFLAAALALFFAYRALMGWPAGAEHFNFREADLLGMVPDRVGWVSRRRGCPVCGEERSSGWKT